MTTPKETAGPMTVTVFAEAGLARRTYNRRKQAVLLPSKAKAVQLLMLLHASDRRPHNWQIGTNENGWWFVFEPHKSDAGFLRGQTEMRINPLIP